MFQATSLLSFGCSFGFGHLSNTISSKRKVTTLDPKTHYHIYILPCESNSRGDGDEDISTVDTTVAPAATHPHVPPLQGPLTRARARQLNYQVLSFLGTLPNVHENMMLPKSDVFMLLRNDGPSLDEKDKHWSMIVRGEEHKLVRVDADDMRGYFRTLKPP